MDCSVLMKEFNSSVLQKDISAVRVHVLGYHTKIFVRPKFSKCMEELCIQIYKNMCSLFMCPGGKTEFYYYFVTAILSLQERGLKSSTGVLSSAKVCLMLHVNKAVISTHQAGFYY